MYPTPLVFMKHGGFVNLRGRKSLSDVFPGMVSNCDFWFLWKRAEACKDYVHPRWTFESARAVMSLGVKGVAGLALNGCSNLSLRVQCCSYSLQCSLLSLILVPMFVNL